MSFDFFKALREMLHGSRVTKREWGDENYWGQFLSGQLVLHKPDGIFYPWIITDGDLAGDDWVCLT